MKKYVELSDKEVLNSEEMFEVKGGYVCYSYGCNNNVCTTNIKEAEPLCTTAYCRSKATSDEPVNPPKDPDPICIFFAKS